MNGRAVTDVGEVDGAVGPELQVFEHERNLEHRRGEVVRQALILCGSDDVQARHAGVYVHVRDALDVVVVPEHGGFLGVRVRVVLGCVGRAIVTERREPGVRVAVVEALGLGAVQVHHGGDAAVGRHRPVHCVIDRQKVVQIRDVVVPIDVGRVVSPRFQRVAWVLGIGLACSVCVESGGRQIPVHFLHGTNTKIKSHLKFNPLRNSL